MDIQEKKILLRLDKLSNLEVQGLMKICEDVENPDNNLVYDGRFNVNTINGLIRCAIHEMYVTNSERFTSEFKDYYTKIFHEKFPTHNPNNKPIDNFDVNELFKSKDKESKESEIKKALASLDDLDEE